MAGCNKDMEQQDIKTLLRTHFSRLPEKLQSAITESSIPEKLRAISKEHRLHLDQGQSLENETYMVMLGIEESDEYEKNIKKELQIDSETAGKIASAVGKEIFLPIRDALKELTVEKQQMPTETTEKNNFPKEKIGLPIHRPIQKEIVVDTKNNKYVVDPYREPIE